ncbi:MAG: hypothetical protein R3266_06685 [Gemmatimonadota bacterium]|nr:hypothetical protein [Gemmatimonadota bacterium]
MNTVQQRLRHWREAVEGLSLRELLRRVNEELPPEDRISLGTLSNYERSSGDAPRAGPRAAFLGALKRAFPELRLEWLIAGEGRPTETAERLASPEGLEAKAEGGASAAPVHGGGFARRALDRYPDLELLAPEASALFMAALTRLAMSEPELALDEDHLHELAGDLRWLLLVPLGMWGFESAPDYDAFSDYATAMLHALMLLAAPAGGGEPIDRYADSAAPKLRDLHPVGFSD